MKYTLQAYGIYELGQRSNQEDALFPALEKINPSDRLFIVCDGMGGHESGEVASNLVCKTMSRSIFQSCPCAEGTFSDHNFEQALSDTLSALDQQPDNGERKMGTTLTFLKFHDKGCTIAHIGDSRVYHIRPGHGVHDTTILFQTSDHSLVNDLIRMGEFTKEESRNFGMKNVITRALQPHMERRPKADFYHTSDIRPGDYFMLCSDGILEEMEDQDLQKIFSEVGGDDQQKIDTLKQVTEHNKDNHSAIVIHVTGVEGQALQQSAPSTSCVDATPVPEAPSAVHSASVSGEHTFNSTSISTDSAEPVKEESKKSSHPIKDRIITLLVLLCTLEAIYLFFVYFFR